MKKKLLAIGALALLAAALGFVPVGGGLAESAPAGGRQAPSEMAEAAMNADDDRAAPPGTGLRLLFVHHSVGGQLLAPEGEDVGEDHIYTSYPRGGGLRALLEAEGYGVGEASYGSRIGERTDLFDWLPKFRDDMDEVLRVDRQDARLASDTRNDVVVFKSCYPNSKFVSRGTGAGNPAGPDLTLVNAQATMTALLPYFEAHPETVFVYVTAPPLAPRVGSEPAWKWLARKLLGRTWGPAELAHSGEIAREFNSWLSDEDGWLADYPGNNVAVFDYWQVLTGDGESNLLHYYVGRGYDSHPAGEGQRRAAPRLVAAVNHAVRRAGLVPVREIDDPSQDESTPGESPAADAPPAAPHGVD